MHSTKVSQKMKCEESKSTTKIVTFLRKVHSCGQLLSHFKQCP